ncbi:hypothetical protein FRC12_001737 [Ceratobasidium sp. 428]|nr:hypothetical protein FRC12_001737 [Ceratobasidium sp. 428]
MQKLEGLLREHFDTKNAKETRAIVFTSFRVCVDEIVTYLKSLDNLNICAAKLIGQIEGETSEKRTNMRDSIVAGFIPRVYNNVLVATSVIENDLAITEDIDLVVCYDALGAPARTFQRAGQKPDGKSLCY